MFLFLFVWIFNVLVCVCVECLMLWCAYVCICVLCVYLWILKCVSVCIWGNLMCRCENVWIF